MAGKEISFLKAMMEHLRMPGEPLPVFAAGIKTLTAKDKAELKAQFEKEFGYVIPENTTTPIVEKGVAP